MFIEKILKRALGAETSRFFLNFLEEKIIFILTTARQHNENIFSR